MALTKIEPTAIESRSPESVVLPDSAVEGLSSPQIDVMKTTVVAVETNMAIAGAALRSSAYELHRLKGLIPKRTWTKFINSGALPVPAKYAQDLVNSWQFISDMGLSNGDLVYISTRALNRIANADPGAQKEAVKRLKSGQKITESQAKELASKVADSNLPEEAKQQVKASLTATQKLKAKDEEIAKLKETIEKQKKEIAKLEKAKMYTVTEVTKNMRSSLKEAFKAVEGVEA